MREVIADESDRATLNEMNATQEYIAKQLRSEKPAPKDWDKLTCYECTNDLPPERIAAGRYLCVPCKDREEKLNKRNGK